MSVVKPAIQYPVLIAYLEGASNYTWLHFRDGGKQLLAKSISYLEKLPELAGFVRTHKTILLNPVCMDQLIVPLRPKMAGAVRLVTGEQLPVSRRRWNEVVTLLSYDGAPPPRYGCSRWRSPNSRPRQPPRTEFRPARLLP